MAQENFRSNLWTNAKFWLKIGPKQKLGLYIKTYLRFCAHHRHKILNTECSFNCVSERSRLRPGKPAYVGTFHAKCHPHRQGKTETVLLEKLTAIQLCTRLSTFYGLMKSITVLTTACNPSMSSARYKQSTPYLLTPWCRVLLEKLTGLQLVKKFPAFYGTRRFITAFISARHLSLPEPARSSPYPHIPLPKDPS